MNIEVFYDPVFHIVIKNALGKYRNEEVLDEIKHLESKFIRAKTGSNNEPSDIRTNTVVYVDNEFNNDRYKSKILGAVDGLFINPDIRDLLSSSPYPIHQFKLTNYHETQLSRYGGEDQRYGWHVDNLGSHSRLITLVYYVNGIPKKYKGGELQLTKSPIIDDKLVDKDAVIKTIKPENDTLVIFGSFTPHRVLPTKSTEKFEDGRFSLNVWVGIK